MDEFGDWQDGGTVAVLELGDWQDGGTIDLATGNKFWYRMRMGNEKSIVLKVKDNE